ncbi:hypothetical protein ABC195_09455 [Microbacterium sp. 2P01SA-2]|uniref:hypothetical protein n=1 Tax=unclassified Microbacterium TaxID=2609290 RepID=UPI0039A3F757
MTTNITAGDLSITPTILTGLTEASEGGAIVHPILGRAGDPDWTLRGATPRTGRLELGFAGPDAESASEAAVSVLRTPAVFTLADTDRATYGMRFVVPAGGRVERIIEDETRAAFVVAVDYAEVRA